MLATNLMEGFVMRVKTKSKLTSIIRLATVFAITITGAEKIHGAHRVEEHYVGLMAKQAKLHSEEKANLEVQLIQKEQLVQRELDAIKLEAGGSGANTPLPVRIGKLRKQADTANTLGEKLSYLQSDTLVEKIEALEKTLKDTEDANERLTQQYVEAQHNIVELQNEVGLSAGDTPVQVRARKLSDSVNQNANDLAEAVSALAQELYNVPGNDLLEKINSLKKELDSKTNALVEAQKVIVEKEEAHADLYIHHLHHKPLNILSNGLYLSYDRQYYLYRLGLVRYNQNH